MEISFICVVLFFKLIEVTGSVKCISETKNGSKVYECCADYEAKEGGCIACSIGYTSNSGQNCQPCPKNTYGEKCSYDCSCAVDEICDSLQGCLKIQTSTGFPVHNAFDTTMLPGGKNDMSSSGSIDNSEKDVTTLQQDIVVNPNGDQTGYNTKELVSRDVIVYSVVSVLFVILGIFLCIIFNKFKIVENIKTATQSYNHSLHVPRISQDIGMEDGLYDVIGDTDMLGYVRQMLKSTDV